MTTQYDSGRSPSTSFFTFVFALLLGAVGFAFLLHHFAGAGGLPARLAALVAGRTESFNISVPAVVERIQSLNRLETVVYSLDTVVEGGKSSPVFPDILAGDHILLVVHGQSIAGVDLGKLKPEDVRVDITGTGQRTLHIVLPASEIFSTALDAEHTRVYSRATGVLVPADPNLESDTRLKAQQQLNAAALQDGILDAARRNARASLTLLLTSLGFQQVDIK